MGSQETSGSELFPSPHVLGVPRVSPHFSQNVSVTTWDVTAQPCFLGNPLSLISAISIMNGSVPAETAPEHPVEQGIVSLKESA